MEHIATITIYNNEGFHFDTGHRYLITLRPNAAVIEYQDLMYLDSTKRSSLICSSSQRNKKIRCREITASDQWLLGLCIWLGNRVEVINNKSLCSGVVKHDRICALNGSTLLSCQANLNSDWGGKARLLSGFIRHLL